MVSTSIPSQENIFIWLRFFQYNSQTSLAPNSGWGVLVYAPHNGYWPAGFEELYLPPKLDLLR